MNKILELQVRGPVLCALAVTGDLKAQRNVLRDPLCVEARDEIGMTPLH